MDADFIARALKTRHPNEAWIYATEVRTATGYRKSNDCGLGGIRYIDAFAMALWPSKDFQRIAYEIKCSRSDWLAELKNPTKRLQAYQLADKFYFVLAENVGNWRDMPLDALDCGLIIVKPSGELDIQRGSRKPPAWPMPEWFIGSFLRSVRDTNWPDYSLEALKRETAEQMYGGRERETNLPDDFRA